MYIYIYYVCIYIYISATVPPCTKLACGVFNCVVLLERPTETPFLEKWQSHCSEKVNEIDFSKGVPKSRNWKFAPLCSEIATFAENVRFLLPGEPGRRYSAAVPGGTLKSPKFRYFLECVWNGLWKATGPPKCSQGRPKKPKRTPKCSLEGVSGPTFDAKMATLAPC